VPKRDHAIDLLRYLLARNVLGYLEAAQRRTEPIGGRSAVNELEGDPITGYMPLGPPEDHLSHGTPGYGCN